MVAHAEDLSPTRDTKRDEYRTLSSVIEALNTEVMRLGQKGAHRSPEENRALDRALTDRMSAVRKKVALEGAENFDLAL